MTQTYSIWYNRSNNPKNSDEELYNIVNQTYKIFNLSIIQ